MINLEFYLRRSKHIKMVTIEMCAEFSQSSRRKVALVLNNTQIKKETLTSGFLD
jgi:hypothetical protein